MSLARPTWEYKSSDSTSKCTKCSAEITYKTDPKNSDYTVESVQLEILSFGVAKMRKWRRRNKKEMLKKWVMQ
ncbi:hypothetical protein K7X08_029115 [Anisodus acutangulus]|uniref:Uncharacterized protein n=1 Tax=Anisodus acutangulus TaxID=402998 RepID=A0A9Q1QSL0_9SOLA|nr:hypothetical protein K7X08_029115 [Anisodus acutangulus]